MEKENLVSVQLLNDKFRMKVQVRKLDFVADEPEESGGEGQGPDPFELLSASLATCTVATLQMYLKRKGWLVQHLSTQVSFEEINENSAKSAHFLREVEIKSELNKEQIERLKQIAEACPVSKILKSGDNLISTIIYEI